MKVRFQFDLSLCASCRYVSSKCECSASEFWLWRIVRHSYHVSGSQVRYSPENDNNLKYVARLDEVISLWVVCLDEVIFHIFPQFIPKATSINRLPI